MDTPPDSIQSSGKGSIAAGEVSGSVLVTGSQNVIIQAEQVMLQAVQQATQAQRDPGRMLRILALLAAPVHDPLPPGHSPMPLDLLHEWHVLAQEVRQSHAPILLARLTPPTLDALRRALSQGAVQQHAFPQILHFSGHAWRNGLLLEDELGQVHAVTTDELLRALEELPQPLDLVVLNGCESAAAAESVAQALLEKGLARAVVGHPQSVWDYQAVKFAAKLYKELTDGFPLRTALERAGWEVTTTQVGAHGRMPLVLGDVGFE
ncbi:MAG: CHAT domain-containing protein, partial [Anaerolineae bacterium]